MRIVSRDDFLKLPAGTLFSKFEPLIFEDLAIKGDTSDGANDFMYQPIASAVDFEDTSDLLDKTERATKESVAMDLDCQSRDGCFDESQMFLVWERADVEQLIARLNTALEDGY